MEATCGQAAEPVSEWAERNFRECDLGDKRRNRRVIEIAEQMSANPSASLPDQLPAWSDLKAAYRLFDCEQATLPAIAGPHWRLTRELAAQRRRVLVIGDTTELDFGRLRTIEGVGPTGNGTGNGFLLHNAMMVDADNGEILGIAGQTLHLRKRKKKGARKENASQLLKRDRESEVWGTVIDEIGPPAKGVEYMHVFDRGADNFEVYCHLLDQCGGWVIRASKLERQVLAGAGDEPMKLRDYLPQMKLLGYYELELRARPNQAGRTAKLQVRVGKIRIPRPKHASPWVKARKPEPVSMNVIEVMETDPPKGVEPIRWVLLTSLPVDSWKQVWEAIGFYEQRWLIEEYHKALKTGCKTESHQLKTRERLEALVGITSVVATRLLQLKSFARTNPDKKAGSVVPPVWLRMLKLARKLSGVSELTVGQFYREVAKLGGFLGRKGDGEPGWITIWRGWEKLNLHVKIASHLDNQKKCG
jgi:Transposase DNA-binding/Transposase Tn5 dimerisation domain